MPLEIGEQTIDNIHFVSQQLPAMRALQLGTRLAKFIGPVISNMRTINIDLTQLKLDADSILNADLGAAAGILGGALSNLDEPTFMRIVRDMLANTSASHEGQILQLNTDENLDKVFSGKLLTMMKVLVFVGRLNFKSFFSGLPVLVERGAREETSTSPT